MTQPIAAQRAPYPLDVKAGRTYFWCACGRSNKQPICDGSHKGWGIEPVRYKADADGTVFFCGCKETKKKPLCDGSHDRS